MSQVEFAGRLHVTQGAISELANSDDLRVSKPTRSITRSHAVSFVGEVDQVAGRDRAEGPLRRYRISLRSGPWHGDSDTAHDLRNGP
jgi:hypothetical protein